MLEAVFGTKNVQKILIFLFVNSKCYGTQLQRTLKTPLTPIQKALQRLEKGGVIMSYNEGKTRLHQFNPAFPFLPELEALLKKAYTLLPPHEKKHYTLAPQESKNYGMSFESSRQTLLAFWEKLSQVKHLSFQAKTRSEEESGWNGKGKGDVISSKDSDTVLLFQEKGSWYGKHDGAMGFSNMFRWTLDINQGLISLEHLRRGQDHPVFLFHLAPNAINSLASVDSHLCGGDIYFGQVFFDSRSLRLNWRVIGPKKNEEIDYHYI